MTNRMIKLTGQDLDGNQFPLLLNTADIAAVKPDMRNRNVTIVERISKPDFPFWVVGRYFDVAETVEGKKRDR